MVYSVFLKAHSVFLKILTKLEDQCAQTAVCTQLVLKEHDFLLFLILYSDASDMGLNAVLQPHEDGKHSIFHLRKKMFPGKQRQDYRKRNLHI